MNSRRPPERETEERERKRAPEKVRRKIWV
jgi:hypothetical protein